MRFTSLSLSRVRVRVRVMVRMRELLYGIGVSEKGEDYEIVTI